jgi:hypothetical protein
MGVGWSHLPTAAQAVGLPGRLLRMDSPRIRPAHFADYIAGQAAVVSSRRGQGKGGPLQILAQSRKWVGARRGEGDVHGNSIEMRQFQVLAPAEEPELAPSRAAGFAREGQDEEDGFNGGH